MPNSLYFCFSRWSPQTCSIMGKLVWKAEFQASPPDLLNQNMHFNSKPFMYIKVWSSLLHSHMHRFSLSGKAIIRLYPCFFAIVIFFISLMARLPCAASYIPMPSCFPLHNILEPGFMSICSTHVRVIASHHPFAFHPPLLHSQTVGFTPLLQDAAYNQIKLNSRSHSSWLRWFLSTMS